MDSTSYITLSKQTALRRQMDIIAHNLANVSTSAYKGDTPLFAEYVTRLEDQRPLSYVRDVGIVRDLGEGPMIETGNPLDVAIHGEGHFVIETPRGERYTRNGHFVLNADSDLATSTGDRVLDIDGRPILITAVSGIAISPDGTISSGDGQIARLKVVTFADRMALRREANSLFLTNQKPEEPRDVSIVQGMLERSNVKPILELTTMIDVHRSYQANAKLIEVDSELQRKTVDRLMKA